jgi:peptide methionine sulfoxide reductase MsrA
VIFVYDTVQEKIAQKVKDELQALIDEGKLNVFTDKVVSTDIRRATTFYEAHAEHQSYLDVNPDGYCNHSLRFKAWP